METITLEKVIKFKNQIDKIESVIVHDDLDYKVSEDKMSTTGIIKLTGSVETLSGVEDFNEEVNVDIYTPFSKLNDIKDFKLIIKDYHYMIQNCSLIVHIILELDGIQTKTDAKENVEHEIVNALNQINEIEEMNPNRKEENMPSLPEKEEVVQERKEEKKVDVILKEKEEKEEVDPSWATNLFTLNSSYTTFKVIHVDDTKSNS